MTAWISIFDRMPELDEQPEDDRYAVSVPVLIWDARRRQHRIVRYIKQNGKTWWIDGGGKSYRPTYWTPLPDPPEADA